MAYRNKTFVSFASEDLNSYRLMCAWRSNQNIDFNFYDAHDLNTARDTSSPETIRRRLRERLSNAKQVVMLIGDHTRSKAARTGTFIGYEVEVIAGLSIPIIFANLNKSTSAQSSRMPVALAEHYTMSTSFRPAIIKYALDQFPPDYAASREKLTKGPYQYKESVYKQLGLV